MATCKECLHSNVCESFCGGIPRIMMLGNNAERDCGYYKPTADVVPKSEVEKIFKEIEKIIINDWLDRRLAEYGFCMVKIGKTTLEEHIAELKKKYTERGDNK